MSVGRGSRVKVTNHERKEYGHVGTVERKEAGGTLYVVFFGDGKPKEAFGRWELRSVRKSDAEGENSCLGH